MQLLIVNEPTLSSRSAGDLESEDPYTVRSVNDTWATPVRLMSDDFTASGVASAYRFWLSIVSNLMGPVEVKLSPPSTHRKSVSLLFETDI
jgi:hypothetical protein